MMRLYVEALLLLARAELAMQTQKTKAVFDLVHDCDVVAKQQAELPAAEDICRAVDLVCVFYPKPVLCLQRSIVTTILLRRYGRLAELVIGAQLMPLKSHAWVEINGTVVNDKPYMLEMYQVMERC